MMFEHKLLYGSKGLGQATGAIDASNEIPAEDYTIPLGKGIVRRQGSDVTIIATLLMMHGVERGGELRRRVSVEVIRVLSARSIGPLSKNPS
jgi:pyruvate dehydrogenase E1 component beta subunit